jgi:hypothetical protein
MLDQGAEQDGVRRLTMTGGADRAEPLAEAEALDPDHAWRGAWRLVAYTSTAAHNCVERAFELGGLGADALRRVATDPQHRIDIAALEGVDGLDARGRVTQRATSQGGFGISITNGLETKVPPSPRRLPSGLPKQLTRPESWSTHAWLSPTRT